MSGANAREQDGKSQGSHIDLVVLKNQRLVSLLFPVFVVYDAIVYIARWQNYALTFCVMLLLCFLLYFPALFLGCLLVACILVMAVGRYYSTTQPLSAKKMREPVIYLLLDEDQQALQQHYKDQKNSHKLLQEYQLITRNVEYYVTTANAYLEHMYSILLWKSTEVSLCITVLLCVLLILLFTLELRSITAAIPVFVLCLNRHFIKRSVDTWKVVWQYGCTLVPVLWRKLRTRLKRGTEEREDGTRVVVDAVKEDLARSRRFSPLSSSNHYSQFEGSAEVADAVDVSSDLQDQKTGEIKSAMAQSNSDSEEGKSLSDTEGALPSLGDTPSVKGTGGGGKAQSWKGLACCMKCNASFTLLKRQHDCANCGQTYCGSCVTKVRRTLLGATSPAAYEASVKICLDCKTKLEKMTKTNL